jgi:hypothetical protein
MKSLTQRRSLAIAATSLTAVTVLALAGCSSSSDDDAEEFDVANGIDTTYEFPNVPTVKDVPEGGGLGAEEQEIGEVGDELNTPSVGKVTPINPDWMITVESKDNEAIYSAIDPETGKIMTRITTGHAIWDDVVHVFTTENADDPQATAFEVWAPRGSRGQSDYTVSTYSGNLLDPQEINLPKHVRFHSREGSHTIAGSGKYLVSWDDQLVGVRVVDLESGELTGELQSVGCGPYTWPVGNKIYSVCENTKELLELTIDDDGKIEETGREKVLPEDFTAARTAKFTTDAKQGFLVNEAGDVYSFDFSDGLPNSEVKLIGNVGKDGGRFATESAQVTPDGRRFLVAYTDSDIHPHSVNGGDVTSFRTFDAATGKETKLVTKEDLELESLDSVAYNYDASLIYVLGEAKPAGNDAEEDAEPVTTLVSVDSVTGEVKDSVEVTGNGRDDVSGLMAPEVREDN